jgi:hypothetical protein
MLGIKAGRAIQSRRLSLSYCLFSLARFAKKHGGKIYWLRGYCQRRWLIGAFEFLI